MRYALLLIVVFLSLARGMPHAREMNIRHFTEKDGLPASTVYNILQDKQGFMWMSTPAGVSRFDGKRFINFSVTDGLAENEILKVAQDSKGRIWFLGFNGTLSYYHNGKFFNPANDPVLKKLRRSSSYVYFFEDSLHRLWFTSQGGYTVINGDKVYYLKLPGTGIVFNRGGGAGIFADGKIFRIDSISGINHRSVAVFYANFNQSFLYLPGDSVLFCSKEGFVRLADTIQELISPLGRELRNVGITSVFSDRAGILWVSTGGNGTYCYNYYNLAHPVNHYCSGHTAGITQDTEGNIWIGTVNDGLYCLKAWNGVSMHYSGSNGLAGDNVLSVVKDGSGTIYAGMGWGNIGIIKGGKVRNIAVNNTEYNFNPVSRILIRGKDAFLGTNVGLLRLNIRSQNICSTKFYDGVYKRMYMPSVKDFCFYKNGIAVSESHFISADTVLLSAPCGKTHFTTIDKQMLRRYAIHADTKGVLWFSDINGLNSYNKGEIVTHATVSAHISESIRSIAETQDSALVLATYGQGIFFYKNNKIVAIFTKKNGLANDICKRVFVHEDNIFAATISGITAFKYNNGSISAVRNYNTSNGLAANNVNDVYADDSDICVATSGGITVFNEQVALRPSPPPPLYITRVRSGDSLLVPGRTYILHHTQNAMHFEYIGISYKSADNVRYEYRLNKELRWIGTKNTSVDFPYLAPGNYKFEIRARIANGPWSSPKCFIFTITPPFWKTNWFAAISIFAVLGMAVIIAFYVVKQQNRKRNKLLAIEHQVATLEQQALQAMMNPHFVFNVMNSIQHFINNNEQHEANVYLSDFARLIRVNMDISSRRLISLDEEIAYLQLYLSLERLRFGDRLVYALSVDEDVDTDETMIPVMMLQPFVENALLHGILPLKGTGHLTIDIRKQGEQLLKITITDDGVGMETETKTKTHESKGMKMTQQRLALLAKLSGKALHIKTDTANPRAENKGTKVEILLPADLY